jgi:hypothetical protein
MVISSGNSTRYVLVPSAACAIGTIPQPLVGDPSRKRNPVVDGTGFVSAQKYTAGAVPSYSKPRISTTRSLNTITSPAKLCANILNVPNDNSVLVPFVVVIIGADDGVRAMVVVGARTGFVVGVDAFTIVGVSVGTLTGVVVDVDVGARTGFDVGAFDMDLGVGALTVVGDATGISTFTVHSNAGPLAVVRIPFNVFGTITY